MQLQNYAAGQWIAGSGKQADLIDAITGDLIGTTSSGLDFGAIHTRIAAFLISGALACSGHGQYGQLDPTFASNGVLILDSNALSSSLRALVIDANGNYLGVGGRGSFTPDHYLVRITDQGSVDATFGGGGTVVEPISLADDFAGDVGIQPDGKIVVVGSSDSNICVSRFLVNGSLDPTFGMGGKTLVAGSSGITQGWCIAIRPDGRLIAGGRLDNDQAIVQFQADGTLDAAFGVGGIAKIIAPTDFDRIEALAIRQDGRVITVGRAGSWSSSEVIVAQFTASGVLDNSFATAGQLHLDLSPDDDTAEDVSILPDGSAVICGRTTSRGYVARISTAGALDAGFGDAGVSTLVLGGDSLVPLTGLTVQSDGKLVCSGFLSQAGIGQLAVARFNSDGSPDATFGVNGLSIADIGTPNGEGAYDIAITPEGSILVCGMASMGGTTNGLFARFQSGSETGMNELTGIGIDVQVRPVPTYGLATLRIDLPTQQEITVDLLDTHGRTVKELIPQVRLGPGLSEFVIDVHGINTGAYALRCCNTSGCLVRKVLVIAEQ